MPSDTHKPTRWRPRFSVRTLVVIVTLVCAWFGVLTHRTHQREAAIAIIRDAGGRVYFDYEDGNPLVPDQVRSVLGDRYCARVARVDLSYCEIRDEDWSQLSCLVHLRQLWAWNTPITNAGLDSLRLRSFKKLELLNLTSTEITDAGLRHLREHQRLEWLDLRGTQITDAGLTELCTLPALTTLWLEDTRVTDAGLKHLEGMSQLRELNLQNTRITDRGGLRLQQELPRCNVYWGDI